MTTPNGRYFRNTLPKFSECEDTTRYEAVQFKPNADGHILLLHPAEVVDLANRAGLEVDALTLFTNSLTSGHMKTEVILKFLPESAVRTLERATRILPRVVQEVCFVHMAARFGKPPL